MVKGGGGTKRSIPIEKIEKTDPRRVCFTKRRKGLFSKASDLCLLSGSQIAILATPISSPQPNNVSFYSFGHSSVDAIVTAFLSGQVPSPAPLQEDDLGIYMRRKDLGLGFSWDEERLAKSEDPEELRAAINSVSRLLKDVKELRSAMDNQRANDEYLKKNESDGTLELDQNLFESKMNQSDGMDQTLDYPFAISDHPFESDLLLQQELDQIPDALSDNDDEMKKSEELSQSLVMNSDDEWMVSFYDSEPEDQGCIGFDEDEDDLYFSNVFNGTIAAL